jgi:hypothetical protein
MNDTEIINAIEDEFQNILEKIVIMKEKCTNKYGDEIVTSILKNPNMCEIYCRTYLKDLYDLCTEKLNLNSLKYKHDQYMYYETKEKFANFTKEYKMDSNLGFYIFQNYKYFSDPDYINIISKYANIVSDLKYYENINKTNNLQPNTNKILDDNVNDILKNIYENNDTINKTNIEETMNVTNVEETINKTDEETINKTNVEETINITDVEETIKSKNNLEDLIEYIKTIKDKETLKNIQNMLSYKINGLIFNTINNL